MNQYDPRGSYAPAEAAMRMLAAVAAVAARAPFRPALADPRE